MTKEDLQNIQQISKEVLFNVVDICEKNDIKYVLLYGTLLGAIRHKGFIPWDDDVDIAMTRENYMRFLEIADKDPMWDARNEIRIMGSSRNACLSQIKIGRKKTLLVLPGMENKDIFKEVGIDIFLLDSLKKKTKLFYKLKTALRLISLNDDEKDLLISRIKESNHSLKRLYIFALNSLKLLSRIITAEKAESIINHCYVDKSGKSSFVGVALGDRHDIWKKELLEDKDYTLFEGRNLSIPKAYHEVLCSIYGENYMTYPPENKRLRKDFGKWIFCMDCDSN